MFYDFDSVNVFQSIREEKRHETTWNNYKNETIANDHQWLKLLSN